MQGREVEDAQGRACGGGFPPPFSGPWGPTFLGIFRADLKAVLKGQRRRSLMKKSLFSEEQIVADLTLDKDILQEALRKKW